MVVVDVVGGGSGWVAREERERGAGALGGKVPVVGVEVLEVLVWALRVVVVVLVFEEVGCCSTLLSAEEPLVSASSFLRFVLVLLALVLLITRAPFRSVGLECVVLLSSIMCSPFVLTVSFMLDFTSGIVRPVRPATLFMSVVLAEMPFEVLGRCRGLLIWASGTAEVVELCLARDDCGRGAGLLRWRSFAAANVPWMGDEARDGEFFVVEEVVVLFLRSPILLAFAVGAQSVSLTVFSFHQLLRLHAPFSFRLLLLVFRADFLQPPSHWHHLQPHLSNAP